LPRRQDLFASVEGVLTVIQPADKLNVIARNDFQEPLYATPAVIGAAIYVRTPAHLYAFAGTP
jgi:hypothetical protein